MLHACNYKSVIIEDTVAGNEVGKVPSGQEGRESDSEINIYVFVPSVLLIALLCTLAYLM